MDRHWEYKLEHFTRDMEALAAHVGGEASDIRKGRGFARNFHGHLRRGGLLYGVECLPGACECWKSYIPVVGHVSARTWLDLAAHMFPSAEWLGWKRARMRYSTDLWDELREKQAAWDKRHPEPPMAVPHD